MKEIKVPTLTWEVQRDVYMELLKLKMESKGVWYDEDASAKSYAHTIRHWRMDACANIRIWKKLRLTTSPLDVDCSPGVLFIPNWVFRLYDLHWVFSSWRVSQCFSALFLFTRARGRVSQADRVYLFTYRYDTYSVWSCVTSSKVWPSKSSHTDDRELD